MNCTDLQLVNLLIVLSSLSVMTVMTPTSCLSTLHPIFLFTCSLQYFLRKSIVISFLLILEGAFYSYLRLHGFRLRRRSVYFLGLLSLNYLSDDD